MKKLGFFICVMLLLGYVAVKTTAYYQQKSEITLGDYENQGMSLKGSKTVTQDQVYQGDLLLVNKDYPVQQEGVKSDIVNLFKQKDLIQGYVLLDHNTLLSKHVAQEFQKMIEVAGKEGVNRFLISSGYRDFEKQDKLYEEMGSAYALPAGYSEHNLGLSLDVGSTQTKMSKADEGKWLKKNAWKYGFILRYPKDKIEITGIQYEPWHFRYVGLPHSAIMQESNLVLEQYLDFLKEKKSISAVVEGEEYNVSYYSVSKKTILKVPENGPYEISGNNIDGVIVTVKK
ncbi:D-Ala-D-Ala carboxypeptidase VanY [Paenibacillus macquariensis subsp. macquariensis]|uniref:D-Ala-D-Ala carboxypeptidase. Metallo peptidase. MEROPS family M15B n=1 Tax=Paenibacillus macquariensis TaxID=948756 RepID=A0ABY1KAK1_9BACL|nr:M15 family metallopeptidase [Paenibacillus macquariensis]MEC0093663.1 M15 family metallopeptidase [Paenibacillus macquariensis]OAB31616.1 D-Ala-D-Ala carboxypeptidase VanY [Paenibacillus macquariensis subsp. macquariensis]SIR51335.1 D-Ala-D-Ala carboxypeptidase. Metallo peptidase. MEROPS family M15B [Paenibacillus macquariensis]